MNWWESLIVHTAGGILRSVLKNPAQAKQLKHISLDIYTGIKEAYPGDADFGNA